MDIIQFEMAEDKWKGLMCTFILGWKDVNGSDELEDVEDIGSCTITAHAMWRQMEVLPLEMAVANRYKRIYTYSTEWKDVKEDVLDADEGS